MGDETINRIFDSIESAKKMIGDTREDVAGIRGEIKNLATKEQLTAAIYEGRDWSTQQLVAHVRDCKNRPSRNPSSNGNGKLSTKTVAALVGAIVALSGAVIALVEAVR